MLSVRRVSVSSVEANGNFWPLTFFNRSRDATFPCLRMVDSEKNFAAHDFNRMPAHTHVNYAVIGAVVTEVVTVVVAVRRAHKNAAGAPHLHTLFNQDTFLRLGHAMRYHPGRSTPCGRTRCGVLAVIEQHARVQPGF